MQGGFFAKNFFGVINYIGHYEPLGNFSPKNFGPGLILKFLGAYPKPPPKISNFLFQYLAQCVIHGWKALVLRIPELFLFFLCDAFWPSYGQKRDSKNVGYPPKSPIYGQKSGSIQRNFEFLPESGILTWVKCVKTSNVKIPLFGKNSKFWSKYNTKIAFEEVVIILLGKNKTEEGVAFLLIAIG